MINKEELKDKNEKLISSNKIIIIYLGFVVLAIISLVGFYLVLHYFDDPSLTPVSMFNIGIDVLGMFVCGVLYLGCIGDSSKETEKGLRWFVALIVLNGLSFFVNELSWLFDNVLSYQTLMVALVVIKNLLDLNIIFVFYRCIRATLSFDSRRVAFLDKLINILLVVFSILVIIDPFISLTVGINENGFIYRTPLDWIQNVYLAVVGIIATMLLIRSDTTKRQKLISFSFILVPVLHYLASGFATNYASQYASTLLSIIAIYCLVFISRSRTLAGTRKDLDMAKDIQLSTMPGNFLESDGFEISASVEPAKGVGGDFYDFFMIDDDHLCLVMADVSGKGIPAALFMMTSKAALKNCVRACDSIAKTLTLANESICSDNNSDMFVTVWLGILELSTGILRAGNAGHEYPAVGYKGKKYELLKDKHGFVLGVMDGLKYEEYEIELKPGDKIFVYTDGVPEATDEKEKLYGTERMVEALNIDPDASTKDVLKNVRQSIADFVGDAEQFDDLTMMCVEYKGNKTTE